MFRCLSRSFALLFLLLFSVSAWAAKTDVVYLKNGDRITGEVKGLDRAMLEFSTDSMGTVYVEWTDILEVVSSTGQTVELTNGQRFYGPLAKPDGQEMVTVETEQGPVGVSTLDVVSMYPVESGFWDRLDISANLGFSWDKASGVGKYSIGIDTELRNPKFVSRASFTSEITTQEGRDDTTRATLNASHYVFRRNKRYHTFWGNMENNDGLGLDLRVVVGAGYGFLPIRNQRNWLALGAGLAVNKETPSEGEAQTSLEAVGALRYSYFKYSDPERSLNTELSVFPSLTEAGRWRATFNTDFKLEFISDLFWKLSLYASYDSDPISQDELASKSDYGVISSFAYKF
jgi:hypothetical protein